MIDLPRGLRGKLPGSSCQVVTIHQKGHDRNSDEPESCFIKAAGTEDISCRPIPRPSGNPGFKGFPKVEYRGKRQSFKKTVCQIFLGGDWSLSTHAPSGSLPRQIRNPGLSEWVVLPGPILHLESPAHRRRDTAGSPGSCRNFLRRVPGLVYRGVLPAPGLREFLSPVGT